METALTTSIAEALREATELLQTSHISDSRRETSSLLQHVLGRDRTFLIAHPEFLVTQADLEKFRAFVKRRACGEPLQYITGQQEFFGLTFEVSTAVLIPRPETELLVEIAVKLLSRTERALICDVGTGSGCVAIALLHQLPGANAVALDISAAALGVAKRNAARHGVTERIKLVNSDCFSELDPDEFSFDVIVSNPPYVSDVELRGLQREVREFEPHTALAGGADGLDLVRRLLADASRFLKPEGYLLIEIGFKQAQVVEQLVDPKSWTLEAIQPDLQGIPRLVLLKKPATDLI
jgi:release factor glutamine methyltransferase